LNTSLLPLRDYFPLFCRHEAFFHYAHARHAALIAADTLLLDIFYASRLTPPFSMSLLMPCRH